MSIFICRSTMMACPTPGMCSPHSGCRPPETLYAAVSRDELNRLREDAEKFRKLRTFVFIDLDSSGAEYVAIDLTRAGSSDFIRINELDLALEAALLAAQGEGNE